MCPDPQLLSIYLDGELPSPWKEKLQDHFTQCPKCKEKLENYKRQQILLRQDVLIEHNIIEQNIKERVWSKIESKHSFTHNFNRRSSFIPRIWKRRLSIPLPAAAAVIILLLSVFLFQIQGNNAIAKQLTESIENTNFNLAAEMDNIDVIPEILPTASMSELLEFIAPNTGANIIILQLPESKNFSRAGEPAIIRAADYTRR